MGAETWNKCDVCGQFIALEEFLTLAAIHRILEPDSDLGVEKWETYHCAVQREARASGFRQP